MTSTQASVYLGRVGAALPFSDRCEKASHQGTPAHHLDRPAMQTRAYARSMRLGYGCSKTPVHLT